MNYGEGRILQKMLEGSGHTIVPSMSDADILVLNTCGVIGFTEHAMYRRMGEFAATGKQLVVTGCLAGIRNSEIRRIAPEALIIPPVGVEMVETLMKLNTDRGSDCWVDIGRNDVIVPIAQGCLSLCTYCFSRLSRGRVKSVKMERIVEAVERASHSGIREILLSAMDTAAYGRDIGTSLPELLMKIALLKSEFRIRVGMMNPQLLKPILNELLDAYSDRRIYKFFHLPLQSGSDSVLQKMKRGYTASEFVGMVRDVRRRYPDATLSTDIITGFPGETEDDFRMTQEVIGEIQPDVVNVTRFSAREGTSACRMKDQVPGWISKERSRRITRQRFEIAALKNREYEGMVVTVHLTEEGKNGYTIGRLDNYRQVIVKGRHIPGALMQCRITGSSPVHLIAVPDGTAEIPENNLLCRPS